MAKRQSQSSPSTTVKRKRSNDSNGSSSNKAVKTLSDYNLEASETWISLAKCANTLGLTLPAIRSYESAVEHDSANPMALSGLSYSLRMNDINLNETIGSQISIDKLNRALESYPDLKKSHLLFQELAECYLLIGLNDQAYQAIQAAIHLSPNDGYLWLLSAQTLIRAGARGHAASSLAHSLSLLPDSLSKYSATDIETARTAHAELAAIAAADGNIEFSISELTSTLSLPPPPLSRIDEHVALWCALATAKERVDDIEGAINACEDAEMAVGNSERVLTTHAYLLLNSKNKNDASMAISLLDQYVDIEKERENEQNSTEGDFLPWYLMGKAYSIIDEPRLSYDFYQVALRKEPESPITMLAVGKLYLEFKQLPDALAAYSQALRLQMDYGSPSSATATAWDGLSCVYERCDDQLADAADACSRAAACIRLMGDEKGALYFDERSKELMKAYKKEAPQPPLREPPDVPPSLLRDLVALLPSERITFVHGNREEGQQQAQLQQEAQAQQAQAQAHAQLQAQAQVQAQHISNGGSRQHSLHHSPQQQSLSPKNSVPTSGTPHVVHPPAYQGYPHAVTPNLVASETPQQALQSMYPVLKQDSKLTPKQPQQLAVPQRSWSPGQPQYFYQQSPFMNGQLPPPFPPPPTAVQQPQRNGLPNPVIPIGGTYPVVSAGPAPAGVPYGHYVPMQGGMMAHMPQFAPPVNNWKR